MPPPSGFDQVYRLILAAYYGARAFGVQSYVAQALTQSVPYICSCKLEGQYYANQFGSQASQNAAKLQFCSEGAETASTTSGSSSSGSSSSGSSSSGSSGSGNSNSGSS